MNIKRAFELYQEYGNYSEPARILGISWSTTKRWVLKYKASTYSAPQELKREPAPDWIDIEHTFNDRLPIRLVVIGDAHDSPELPKDRFKWAGRYIAEVKPDAVVVIGDFLTLDSLNTHDRNHTLKARAKPTFVEDISSAKESLELLTGPAKALGLATKWIITEGNHENRAARHENENPEMQNHVHFEVRRLFQRFGFEWNEYGAYRMIGGVGFTHIPHNKVGKPFGGVNVLNNVAMNATFDVVFGHAHNGGQAIRPKIGNNAYVMAYETACFMPDGHVENYAKHSQSGWRYGINEMTIFGSKIQDYAFVSIKTLERKYGK